MPQHALTSLAGFLANHKCTWLKNRLIRYFINRYPIEMAEAILPDPFQYPSFNDFFIRSLKSELRPIASGIYDLVSPADGAISQLGNINAGKLLQAKNHYFSAHDLLGGNDKLAEPFNQGSFLTVYLAPTDYHRVHMPIDGRLTHMVYVPGRLFSVNTHTANTISNLFSKNERVIAFFDTSVGRVAIVMVGAMIVGSIETVWAGTVAPPRTKQIQNWNFENSIQLKRGEEMGRFKLGSTVVVLFESENVTLDPHLKPGDKLKYGQTIGLFKPDRL